MTLNKSARRLLDFIESFHAKHGRCPNYPEMVSGLGFASKGPIVRPLNELVAARLISRESRQKNGLSLPRNSKSRKPAQAAAGLA